MEHRLTNSVILVAHGSGMIEEDTRWRDTLLGLLRHRGIACRVDMAFIKGLPSVDEIMRACPDGEVRIMPLCLSEGVFCHRIIPDSIARSIEDRSLHVRYLSSLAAGEEQLLHLLEERVCSLVPEDDRGKTRFLFVSHGSESNNHADNMFLALERTAPGFKSYSHAYLEQAPSLKDVLGDLPEEDLFVLPYFLGRGHHTLCDIPSLLGIAGGAPVFGIHRTGGRLLYYAEPLGTHPALVDIIEGVVSGACKGSRVPQ